MGWNEHSDPDMRTANFCDVYREGVYKVARYTGTTVVSRVGYHLGFFDTSA